VSVLYVGGKSLSYQVLYFVGDQVIIEGTAALIFDGELDSDHYDAGSIWIKLLVLELKKGRLGIVDRVCFCRQPLRKICS
jgi:hypothetical protein